MLYPARWHAEGGSIVADTTQTGRYTDPPKADAAISGAGMARLRVVGKAKVGVAANAATGGAQYWSQTPPL